MKGNLESEIETVSQNDWLAS